MSSWKTTLAGVLAIVAAGITMIAQPLLDADAATIPQWGAFFAMASAGVVGLFARDNDKTSKDVGLE